MTMDDLVAANRDGEKDAGGSDMDGVAPLHNRQSGYVHFHSEWRKSAGCGRPRPRSRRFLMS